LRFEIKNRKSESVSSYFERDPSNQISDLKRNPKFQI
jgi:hypothetical protein